MSLSSALGIAQSSLANQAAQSALLSKNIANVSNPDYSLESAGTITQIGGGVTTGATQRATDSALLASLLSAQSASPSTAIGAFADALQQYEAAPDNASLGADAVTAAQSLAINLNQASASIQSVREQADSDIASSVSTNDTRDDILKQLSNEIGINTVQGQRRQHGGLHRQRYHPLRDGGEYRARHRARLPGLGAADKHGERYVLVAAPGLQLSEEAA